MRQQRLGTLILGIALAACGGASQSASSASGAGGATSGTNSSQAGASTGATGASGTSSSGHSGGTTGGSAGGTTGTAGSNTGSSGGGSGSGGASTGAGSGASTGAASGASAGASTGTAGGATGTAGGMTGTTGTSGSSSGSVSSQDGGAEAGAMGGGDASTADAAAACPAATPRTGGTQYCQMSGNGTVDGNYTYNLYSSGQGMGCLTVFGVDATFKANWMGVADWIGRVGLQFDKTKTYDQLGTLSSDFAYTTSGITTGGFGNVGIYGWSVNPLHEYYIEEDWLGKRPAFTPVATFTIDGEGTYDVMTNTQNNQPNITGTNATFVQFWSVRQTPRQCGHISISKHFAEWASLGMQLGDLEEARILVEAQNNSGTIEFTTATVVQTQ